MKEIFFALAIVLFAGCQKLSVSFPDIENTKVIDKSEASKLPESLSYGDLVELWGPATPGDPFYLYRSYPEGTFIAVFKENIASNPFEESVEDVLDEKVLSIYYMGSAEEGIQHLWGIDQKLAQQGEYTTRD